MDKRRLARIYFGIDGNPNMVLHHKDTDLKVNDFNRYNEWRIEDLVPMTVSEHISLHKKGCKFDTFSGSNHYKARKIIELNSGEIFGSIKDACEKYSINRGTLKYALKYGNTIRQNGTKWRYCNG